MTIQYNKDQTIYIRTGKDNPTLKAKLTKLAELKGLTLNQFLINKLKEIKS